jgi:hypothetical protein
VQALLDLSQVATNGMYGSVVALLIAGIAAAFIAGLWDRGWIWAAIVLLVPLFAAMYARATTWFADVLARGWSGALRDWEGTAVRGAAGCREARSSHGFEPPDGDRGDRVGRSGPNPVANGDEAPLAATARSWLDYAVFSSPAPPSCCIWSNAATASSITWPLTSSDSL